MAKKAKAEPVVDVLDLIPEDEAQIISIDGGVILGWLQKAAEFFRTGRELEKSALSVLATAKGLIVPTTADADVVIQKFIQRTTADKKEIEAHWGICAVVHRVHRRLTAKRDVGVKALEEANQIGNRLHNAYTAAERRRAEEEENRRREQAEFEARQLREQELARAEQDAVEREAASPDLSDREARFVEAVWQGRNTPETSARLAGYRDPRAAALKLAGQQKILDAIKAKQDAAEIRRQAAVRAAAPIVPDYQEVTPDIKKAAGAFDRTTVSGVIVDVDALRQAYLSGKYGLPADLMEPVQRVVNDLARQMGPRLNTIPGLRYKSETKVI